MKKIILFGAAIFASLGFVKSQVAAYSFAQTAGTYNAITGGTVIATATGNSSTAGLDDIVYNLPSGTFPFTFNFNGIGYTGCNITTNGFITFGSTAPGTSNYSPISSTTSYAGAISAWGGDLDSFFNIGTPAQTGELRVEVVGVAPNREVVIQYTNWRPSYSSSTSSVYGMNFQIRLAETTNIISIVYGPGQYFAGSTSYSSTRQIGLRGATNTDFNNRTNSTSVQFGSSTAGTTNSSSQAYNTTASTPGMPSSGLTYQWTPPQPCSGTPNAGTSVASYTSICAAQAVNLSLSGTTNATGLTFQWYSSPDGLTWTPIASGNTPTLAPTVTVTTYFQAEVSCGANTATSTPVTVNFGLTPNVGNSTATSTYVCPNAAVTLSVTGSTFVPGLTYQWYSSPNGVSYSAVTNATLISTTQNVATSSYYQNVLTCGAATATSSPIQVTTASTTIDNIPYYESFEGITVNNQLPNCSWAASNLPTINRTYTAATGSYNQYAKTGTKFASFRWGTNSSGDYFYTNGLNLTAGVNYIASADYITDGGSGWSEFSLLYGTSQSSTGLTSIASATGALQNTVYNNLNGTFSVSASGVYYLAIKAIGNSSPWYLSFDDVSVIVAPTCTTANGGTLAATSLTACEGQSVSLTSNGANTGLNSVYQWMYSTTAGGPYTVATGGNGASTTSYTTPALSAGIYYAVLQAQCTSASLTAVSNEATVTVSSNPTIAVSPLSSTVCMPGGTAVGLTATGGNSYTWTPSSGITGSGASVNALPASTTIYTVTGDNAAGCTAKATTTVVIASYPVFSSLSASPATVCLNGTSTLQAAATLTTYVVSGIPYSAVSTPSTGVTTLCNNGTTVVPLSSGSLDDGGWSNQSLPFTFNFFGTNYTSFAVSTNGFIFLGTGNPGTFSGYSNAFPSTSAAKPSIGAVYSDLDFDGVGSNSKIEYFITGTTPNQKLVVNWSGQFWSNTGTVTTQAIIYETSNIIEVHTFSSTAVNNAVLGIQNSSGTAAYVAPGRNSVTWPVTTPDAYRFAPTTVTFSWSPSSFLSATNISNPIASNVTSATLYSVNAIADNGCTSTGTLALSVDVPTISITGPTATCIGSSITLSASGASTYTWNTSATSVSITDIPTVNTTYTVAGTDANNCSDTASFMVNVNPSPTVAVTGGAICAGGSFTLSSSGAVTYTYLPNGPVVTPGSTTTYTVSGTDALGCVSQTVATATVTVNSLPSVSLSASSTTACANGQTITLTGSPSGGSYSGANVSGNIFTTPGTAGTFSPVYSYTDAVTGCSDSTSTSIVVSVCIGITEKAGSLQGLKVYPNPTVGEFTIELNNGMDKNVEMTDLTGRTVFVEVTGKDKLNVNLSGLANGVYFVKVQSNNAVEVIKVVKQ